MKRYDIINSLIKRHAYKRYLEIGVASGESFRHVLCELKHGVDPYSKYSTHQTTSDEFFRNNKDLYDIIFVDGLHIAEQVQKDIGNSLNILQSNGTIVVHDCLPKEKRHQERTFCADAWTGDVWKGFAEFRFTRPDLFMMVIDCDWGCGIIQRGKQDLFPRPPVLDWDYFSKNKQSLINIMSEEVWSELGEN